MGALRGIRVVDLTHHLAGPVCTRILADLGAEVLKIEPPDGGEAARRGGNVYVGEWSTLFLASNRNKKSVAVNLKTDRGRQLVQDLCRSADVVVQNFRPGTADRLGMGFEELRAINPRLVYCSLSAFGSTGPLRDKHGLDIVAQAMGGMMSLTGETGGKPVPAGAPVGDVGAGIFAALGTIAALFSREQTGTGQHVEVSMLDAVIALLDVRVQHYLATGVDMAPLGDGHPQSAPWQSFQARDEPFVVAVNSETFWDRFCQAIGRPDLYADPRFANNASRVANRSELVAILSELFVTDDRNEWLARLTTYGVPCGPINRLSQVVADEQATINGMFPVLEHPTLGPITTVALPMRFTGTPTVPPVTPPRLGEHTADLLGRTLGLDQAELDALAREGVIRT